MSTQQSLDFEAPDDPGPRSPSTVEQPTRQPLDQAVRDLISRDGLARSLFVEAGAGTGKTSQLVDRITNLVLADGVPLANIAAITFTEAAAAELQTRIRVRFEKRLGDAVDADERARCRQALADADMAAISTLHGFASRLLGEFSVAAGLPPRVRVLDEVSSQLADEDRWGRFVDRLYDDPDRRELLVRAALLDIALEPRYPGQTTLKEAAVRLSQSWDQLDGYAARALPPMTPVDFSAFDDAAAVVAALPPQCADPDDLFCRNLVDNVIPRVTQLAAISDPGRKLALLAPLATDKTGWKKGNGGKAGNWGGDIKAAKGAIDQLNEATRAVVGTVADEVLTQLLVLVSREVLAAARARQTDGGLQFHDLLVLARHLLRTSEDARTRLHERYTHLLLDEFQDTDPIQIELALLIAAGVTGSYEGTWRDLEVAPGRVFFVGDPKQSIYRFRRADIELFLQARDRFGVDGNLARLTTNFRTVGPILDWVNTLFTKLMAEEKPGMQPAYEPLDAWRQAGGAPGEDGSIEEADHRPTLLGGVHDDPKVRAATLREAEATDVAATIADIVARPERWPVDDGHGGWRRPALADVTILAPARTSVPYLRDALDRYAIPYRLATGTLVYSTQEVRDTLLTLRAIDDPTDELSLVGALRSTLFGCSDVDLFTFHQAGGRWNLRAGPPDALDPDHPVRLALDALRELWIDRWWLTPTELLERLLRERHAYLLAVDTPRPAETWKRLRFLADQARAFEEASGGNLRDFLDWTDLQGEDAARVHEPLLPETDDDAVRIMTIHGAKGLEFPIAIVTGMTTKPSTAPRGVQLFQDEDRFELSIRSNLATSGFEPRAELESTMDLHERMRLLYVAATRARDHLVISAHHKGGRSESYGKLIWELSQEEPELWQAGGVEVYPVAELTDRIETTIDRHPPDLDQLRAERERWIAARAAVLDPQRIPQVLSATAVAQEVIAPLTDELEDVAPTDLDAFDTDLDDRSDTTAPTATVARRRGRAGTAIGRAAHATLQVIDFDEPVDAPALARLALRNCEAEAIPEHQDTVAALVRSALASPAVRLAATSTHHREIYVTAPVGTRVIEGYIDLLIETPEGLVVVDYKTDSVTEADLDAKVARYAPQGAGYVLALQESTGLPVVECRFVFCRAKGAVERSISGADLDHATQQVAQVLGA